MVNVAKIRNIVAGSLKISHVTTTSVNQSVTLLNISPAPNTDSFSVFLKSADSSFGGSVTITSAGLILIHSKIILSSNDVQFDIVYKCKTS